MLPQVIIITLVVGIWNAYAVGRTWEQSKDYGGLPRMTALCGAAFCSITFSLFYILLTIVLLLSLLVLLWGGQLADLVYKMDMLFRSLEPLSLYILIANSIMGLIVLRLIIWAQAYRRGKHSRFMFECNASELSQSLIRNELDLLKSSSLDGLGCMLLMLVPYLFLIPGIQTTRLIMKRAGAGKPLAWPHYLRSNKVPSISNNHSPLS